VLRVASPPLSAVKPSVEVPSEKVTVPVAPPGPAVATVAVKVTTCPVEDGFGDADRLIVVAVVLAPEPLTAIVTPCWLATPPIVITIGTDPGPTLAGTVRFTCSSPTAPGVGPANAMLAGCPSIVAEAAWI
jgi:hypothetical protein